MKVILSLPLLVARLHRTPVGRAVHRHHEGVRNRVHARQLRNAEQAPGGDHGRRRGPVRLRQRRAPRRVLHQRREDRGSDASRRTPRQIRPALLESPLSPTRRRHVRGRDREGGRERPAAEPVRHGRGGRRLRQRRVRGPVRHELRRQHALSQQRQRHVCRRHRARRRGGRRLEHERRLRGLRQRRPPRSLRHALPGMELPAESPLRREEARIPRLLPPRQFRGDRQRPLPQQRRRHIRRRLGEGGHRERAGQGSRHRLRRLR